jgi:hypothetical protein
VDAHVHIHGCFDLSKFLDEAARNFRAAAGELGFSTGAVGCLMLAESEGVDRFQELRNKLQLAELPGWTCRPVLEACSLIACRSDEPSGTDALVVIAGRQITTAERVEVLALATRLEIADGAPLDVVIDRAIEGGAVCVLPWGFGKWTGRRGAKVKRILESPRAGQLFLGDISGRLASGPRPMLFRFAESKKIPILPGTDPFPMAGQVYKPGRYGFVLPHGYDATSPAGHVRSCLSSLRTQPRDYGRREPIGRFVRNQLYMQLAKRWTAAK